MQFLEIFGAKYLLFISIILVGIFFLKLPKAQKKEFLLFSLFTLPLIFILSRLAGAFYYNARPFVVGNFIPLIPHAPDNGFPSDHTLLASALGMIVYFYNKKISAILLVLALLIGVSRVFVGVHHLVDIVGSFVLSLLGAAVVYYALPTIKKCALVKKVYGK